MRIRYDTPDWSGFMVSAAYGRDVLAEEDDADYYDAAVRYGFDNDVVGLVAALGYAWKDDEGDTTEQIIASGSLTHNPTGLNLTLAGGDHHDDGSHYGYAKLGWNGDPFSYGATALAIDYYDGSDFVTSGSSSTSWGAQAVQGFDRWNLEGYLGYRVYSFDDDTGAEYEDLAALLLGARWKF
jgi:predicted porin